MRQRRFYFDMDGVIVDFDLHYCNLIENWREKNTNPYRDTNWKAVEAIPDFFRTIPKMEGADHMFRMIPAEYRWVLSAVAKRIIGCESQKRECLQTNFPDFNMDQAIFTWGRKDKVLHCQPGDILVDDRSDNCADWEAAGGRAILFTSVSQAIKDLDREWKRHMGIERIPFGFPDMD